MLVSAMFVRFFRTCGIIRFDHTVFVVKLVNETRKRNEIKAYWSNGFIVGKTYNDHLLIDDRLSSTVYLLYNHLNSAFLSPLPLKAIPGFFAVCFFVEGQGV